MKKRNLLFTFLITTSVMFAQEFNQFDANGKRHGKWQKNFDKTEVLRYQGEFNHGKEIGTFKFYKNIEGKAVLTATKVFNTNDNTATVTFFTSSKSKISEGQMNGKLHVGQWLYFHKNSSKVMIEEFYNENGKLEGLKKTYYLSGQIAEKANYKNGLLNGEAIWFSEKGAPIKLYTYKDDKFHGPYKTYTSEGVIAKEGQYKNDVKCCVWKRYKDGKLVEEKDLDKRS